MYRDKGYFGSYTKGIDGTIGLTVRNHRLSGESVRGNIRISRNRSVVQYPYTVLKLMCPFSDVKKNNVLNVMVGQAR